MFRGLLSLTTGHASHGTGLIKPIPQYRSNIFSVPYFTIPDCQPGVANFTTEYMHNIMIVSDTEACKLARIDFSPISFLICDLCAITLNKIVSNSKGCGKLLLYLFSGDTPDTVRACPRGCSLLWLSAHALASC